MPLGEPGEPDAALPGDEKPGIRDLLYRYPENEEEYWRRHMMPLVYRPGYVWENGEWRRETPEEAGSEVQPMAARAEPGSD